VRHVAAGAVGMQPEGMAGKGLLVSGTDLMEVVKELQCYLMKTREGQQDWCRKHYMVVAGILDMVEEVLLDMAAAHMVQADQNKMLAVVAGDMEVAADDQVVEAVDEVAEGSPGGEGCSGVLTVGCYDMVGEVAIQSLEGTDFLGQVQEGCCLWLHESLVGMGGCCTSCMVAWEGYLASACVIHSLGAGVAWVNQVQVRQYSLSLLKSVIGKNGFGCCQLPHTQEV